MRARLLLCSLLVLVLIGTNLSGAAGHWISTTADGARLPAEHKMSFRFDAWASKESYIGMEWDLFQISGCVEQGNAGQPRIPHKVVSLQLPSPLAKAEISFADEVRYDSVILEPRAPDYLPGLGILDPSRPLVDEKMYRRHGLLPADAYRIEKVGEGRSDSGQRLWAYNIVLNPLRYDPVSAQAILYQSCKLSLYYDDAPSNLPMPRAPLEKYIIITSDAVNASGALNNLVTWKTNKGLLAKVYTVEWINSTYSGWDTAEKIRNFLKERCWNFGMEWVQLVGDNDTVPVRQVVNPHPILPNDDNWIPTDTYYACLDQCSTWDKDIVNNIYGEVMDTNSDGVYEVNDLDDKFPDVWVARFASSNTTKISAWAQNAVTYEKSPATGNNWTRTALAVAPAAIPAGNAGAVKAKLEEYINRTGGAFGYLGDLYGSANVTRLYEADGTLSRNRVLTAFNNGFAFGTWMANGTFDSFSSSNLGTLFNNTNAGALTNGGRKPVIFGYSSSSGAFDGQECLGEALTENTANGAMGFVGPARTSQISTILGYNNANPNATGMQMDFLNQMVLGKTTSSPDNLYMGRTLGNGKFAFSTWWSTNYEDALKGFYMFNLLGETNCPIWYDAPKDMVPYTRTFEGPDEKIIRVQVLSSTSKPLNQSLVCVYASGYYATNRTGEDGYTYLTAPRNLTDASMTITRPGYLPNEQTFSVTDTWAPDIVLNVTPALPDGKDPWYKTTPQIRMIIDPIDQNATIHYNWDCSTSWLDYTPGQVLMAPDGEHQLYYYATDFIGNGNAQSWRSAQFQVDSSIPNTTVHLTPASPDGENGWYISQPVVNFTINGSKGFATIWYKLDAGPFLEYELNVTIPEGLHDIYYYAETLAGNKEAQRYISFKIDISPPSSNSARTPTNPDGKNGWYRTIPSILIFPDTEGDRIFYRWDNDTEQNYTTGLKAPEGVHTLYWQARDEAGNREPVQNMTLKVDTIAPITCVTTNPMEPDGQKGWFISKTTVSLDPGENGTAFYGWDQGLFFFCVTGPMELMEGTHVLYFYSNDTAGNHETNRQQVFKVDTVVPVTNMTVSPADKGLDWYVKKPRVKLETDQGAGVFYYWDNEVTPVLYTKELEVSEGEHTLHFFAKDDAGNKEIERIKLFKVDSVLPQVAVTLNTPAAEVNTTVIFNLSGTDANNVRDFMIDFGDGNSTGWVTGLSFEHVYTNPGNYTIYVRGRDPAGNEGRSTAVVLEIKAPYVPPIIKPTPPTEEKTNMLPIAAGAIIALVAVAGIAAFAVSRRKSRGPPAPTAEEKLEMERKKALMPTWGGGEGAAGGAGAYAGGVVDRDLGRSGTAGYPTPSAETTPSGGRTSSCPKCGNEVEADADYCYTCGERWGKKGEKAAETDLYKTTPAPELPPQPPSPPIEEAPVYAPEPAPEVIAEAPAVPVETPAAPSRQGDLDDILGQLQSMSAPAPAPPPRLPPARPVQPTAYATVQSRPAQAAVAHQAPRAAPPPPQPAAPAPAQTAATAQGGTGKTCPKCGKEMARLVELPGAQNEQLKRLNAKGQHAFQCRSCGHFEISKWP
jgi:hypothetical protein